ncbi:hypothetical protein ACH42_03485 [Endozoicomonas sp. (ex Bugula neritina AB1)]|nr:hypothetical protein ACH42_03485 [Endozoicomonas sp. (ex Bugula neritina AB1)]
MQQAPSSLNFEMLRARWPELSNLGALTEQYIYTDLESSLVKLRNYFDCLKHRTQPQIPARKSLKKKPLL